MSGKSTFTPELQDEILKGLRLGLYLEQACERAGVPRRTYYDWVKKGKAGKAPYAAFVDLVSECNAAAEAQALSKIREGKAGWQSQAWFLERRFPQRWALRRDQSGIADMPVQKQVVVRFVKPSDQE